MTDNIPEHRKHQRHEFSTAVIITPKGAGQVFDISTCGLSFKCLYCQELPEEWTMDILDSKGLHLQEFNAIKVWEQEGNIPDSSNVFAQEVGVRFKDLTHEQQQALDDLLENLNHKPL